MIIPICKKFFIVGYNVFFLTVLQGRCATLISNVI